MNLTEKHSALYRFMFYFPLLGKNELSLLSEMSNVKMQPLQLPSIFEILNVETQPLFYFSILFVFQSICRIGHSRFDGLKADCQQRNDQGQHHGQDKGEYS